MQPQADCGSLAPAMLAQRVMDQLGAGLNVRLVPIIGTRRAFHPIAGERREKAVLPPKRELLQGDFATALGQGHDQLPFGGAGLGSGSPNRET